LHYKVQKQVTCSFHYLMMNNVSEHIPST